MGAGGSRMAAGVSRCGGEVMKTPHTRVSRSASGVKVSRGNASQFFVAGELCRRGWVAVVTLVVEALQMATLPLLTLNDPSLSSTTAATGDTSPRPLPRITWSTPVSASR